MSIASYIDINKNRIFGDLSLNSSVKIQCTYPISAGGGENIVFLAGKSSNVKIEFHGSNSLVFIGDGVVFNSDVSIRTVSDSVVYIGNNTTMNSGRIDAYEMKNIIIGNDCMFSTDIVVTTTDSHGIYDYNGDRINESDSIYIGDHCWLGLESRILKGARMYSGSVIGTSGVLSKVCYSNSVNAGVPCKMIKDNIYWKRDLHINTNLWNNEAKSNYSVEKTDEFIYKFDKKEFLNPDFIENELNKLVDSYSKLKFIYNCIYCNANKGRFALFRDSKIVKNDVHFINQFDSLNILEPQFVNYS